MRNTPVQPAGSQLDCARKRKTPASLTSPQKSKPTIGRLKKRTKETARANRLLNNAVLQTCNTDKAALAPTPVQVPLQTVVVASTPTGGDLMMPHPLPHDDLDPSATARSQPSEDDDRRRLHQQQRIVTDEAAPTPAAAAASQHQPSQKPPAPQQGGWPAPSKCSSPLSQRIERWHEELTIVHKHTCSNDTNHRCNGVRPLSIICAQESSHILSPCENYRCLQAVEAELLLHDLYYGSPVLPTGTIPTDYPKMRTPNYPCPARARDALTTSVDEEIRLGILRVLGEEPHQLTPLTYKDEANGTKVRPIRDYSAPHDGTSANAHWPTRHFRMMGLTDAYALMMPYCYMAKVDIKGAFRTVSVRPDQQDVLSFQWPEKGSTQPRYLGDTRLPFGWAGSPEAFCRLSTAVRAMMAARGHKSTVVYVDDFLIIGASQGECNTSLSCLLQLLPDLGFTVADNKTAGPSQDMLFLGLRLQSNADGKGRMCVTVPEEKLTETLEVVQLLLARCRKSGDPQQAPRATRRELQSLLGNHIGQVVYSSRAYMRGMINVLKDLNIRRKKGQNKGKGGSGAVEQPRDPSDMDTSSIPLNEMLRRDLYWWAKFASKFNGTAQLLEVPEMMPGYFATDAADWGMGGVLNPSLNGEWLMDSRLTRFSLPWAAGYGHAVARLPKHVQHYVKSDMFPSPDVPNRWWIAYREQFALFYALLLWADTFTGRHVCPYNDNTVAVATFNKLSASNWVMQRLVQAQAGLMADFNFRGTAIWIKSEDNVLCDPLSRGDEPAYLEALKAWHPPQAPLWGRATFSDPPLLVQAAREHMNLPKEARGPKGRAGVRLSGAITSEEEEYLNKAEAEHALELEAEQTLLLRSEW